MEVFTIFGLTFGMAGFVMGLMAWFQIGKVLKKVEAQRKELDELKNEKREE